MPLTRERWYSLFPPVILAVSHCGQMAKRKSGVRRTASNPMLTWRTQIARSPSEIDSLRETWEHLHAVARSATMFQSFAWNRLAAERFAAREAPCVVLSESDSGAALIPAAIAPSGLTMLGEALFDYRNLLCAGTEEAVQVALAQLAELHIPLAFTALRGKDAMCQWAALGTEPFACAPQVLLAEITPETFVAKHSRLLRTLRQLSRLGVVLRQYKGSASELAAHIYDLKAKQTNGDESAFRDPVRRQFMVAACAMDDTCDIFSLESQTTVVAALVTFCDCGIRRFYTIYFDRQWARYSPGTALLFEVTRRSLAEGLDCDYMTGEQPHKLRFMTSTVPLFRVAASAQALANAGRAVMAKP